MRYLIFIISFIGFHLSLLAQKSDIQQLCNNITTQKQKEKCQSCQDYLYEGLDYHMDKKYGKAIYQYTLAFDLDWDYKPADDLIKKLNQKSEYELDLLLQEAIAGAKAIEKLKEEIASNNKRLRDKDKTISNQKNALQKAEGSVKSALQQIHEKGQRAESFRIPSLATRARQAANYKDALYLAFYSILLQEKDEIKGPAMEALMEAGVAYDEMSPTIFPNKDQLLYSNEKIEKMKLLTEDKLLVVTNNRIFIHHQQKNTRLDTQISPSFLLTFSYDKKHVVVAGQDGKVELWDLDKIQIMETFESHKKPVQLCRFSANGDFFVTANRFGEAYIYPLKTNIPCKLQNLDHSRIYGLEISPNAAQILTRHPNGIVKIWNQKGEGLKSIGKQEVYFHDAQFSQPNGKSILTSNTLGEVKQWNINSGDFEQTFKEAQAIKKTYAINSNLWLYHTAKKLVILNNNLEVSYPFDDRILDIEINKSIEKALVWTFGGGLFQIDLRKNSMISYPVQRKNILTARFSQDGNWVVSMSMDGKIKMWDKNTNIILNWQLDDSTSTVARFSKDGKYLFLIDADGKKIKKCPLPALIIEQLKKQEDEILDYLKSKKDNFNLQYLKQI